MIVEKAPKARVPDLDKRKYLVPSDLTGNALSSPDPSFHGKAFSGLPACVTSWDSEEVGLKKVSGILQRVRWFKTGDTFLPHHQFPYAFPIVVPCLILTQPSAKHGKRRSGTHYLNRLKFSFVIVKPIYSKRKTRLVAWKDHILEILSQLPYLFKLRFFVNVL